MNSRQHQPSHLFMVRFWSEDEEEIDETQHQREWRGRVQHVLSGEARTFSDWPMLVDHLLEMARTDGSEPGAPRVRT